MACTFSNYFYILYIQQWTYSIICTWLWQINFSNLFYMSIIFIGMNNLFTIQDYTYYQNKVQYLCSIASLSINVISSVILVQYFGIYAVAFGTFLGSIIWLMVQFLYNKRLFNMNFGLFRPIIYLVNLCHLLYF